MKYVRRQKVENFNLVAHLDTGGMAYVYLATRDPGPELAVVKVLKEQLLEQPDFLAMFLEEARIMASLRHPNVVQVLRSGETLQGQPYLAMEYLPGDHLGVLMREARGRGEELGAGLVARLLLQVANGLDHVHSARNDQRQPLRLVHRDISPPNIFVTYDGRVKILDFGIALAADRSVVTQTGMLKGKVRYMSPEQVQFQPVDHRSDLFAFGSVLWELLVGRWLFDQKSEFQIMKAICELPVPDPRAIRPSSPAALADLAMRCLARDPARRPQQAAEIRAELLEFLSTPEGQSHPEEIARVVDRLLAERRIKKEELIASLQAERDLKDYLFAGLKQPEEDLAVGEGKGEVVSAPRPDLPREIVRPAPSAPVPKPPLAPIFEPAPVRRAPSRLWLGLAGVGLLLLAGLGLWRFWPAGEPSPGPPDPAPRPSRAEADQPPQVGDAGVAAIGPAVADDVPAQGPPAGPAPGASSDGSPDVAAPAGPVSALDAQPDEPEDLTNEGPHGWLRLRTRPVMEAFLDGDFIGKTPVLDMKLKPGVYQIELVDREQGYRRPVTVHIRDAEVSSYEFVF